MQCQTTYSHQKSLLDFVTCPITLETTKFPVVTDCCHRVFEKDIIVAHIAAGNICPWCRHDLEEANLKEKAEITALAEVCRQPTRASGIFLAMFRGVVGYNSVEEYSDEILGIKKKDLRTFLELYVTSENHKVARARMVDILEDNGFDEAETKISSIFERLRSDILDAQVTRLTSENAVLRAENTQLKAQVQMLVISQALLMEREILLARISAATGFVPTVVVVGGLLIVIPLMIAAPYVIPVIVPLAIAATSTGAGIAIMTSIGVYLEDKKKIEQKYLTNG